MELKSGNIFENKTSEEIAKLKEFYGEDLVEITQTEAELLKKLPPLDRAWQLAWKNFSEKKLSNKSFSTLIKNYIRQGFEAGYKTAREETVKR